MLDLGEQTLLRFDVRFADLVQGDLEGIAQVDVVQLPRGHVVIEQLPELR